MTAINSTGLRCLAAGLLALAAVFHVQWLAACDVVPMTGGDMACCADAEPGQRPHCDGDAGSRDCVTPFAKSAFGAKAPERSGSTGDTPADLPPAASSVEFILAVSAAGPPAWPDSAFVLDGRDLYLTSARLRL